MMINRNGNLEIEFVSNINIDNGITNVSQGDHTSTMELFTDDKGIPRAIKWDNPIQPIWIGLWFDDQKRLQDYDGVFELPKEAIKLIRMAKFIVPRIFEK